MLKRSFDFIFASILLVVLSPVLLITILLVRIKHGSPVFYRQQRPGRNGKPFNIIKLRTMRDAFDAKGNPLPDAERLTKFGIFLRQTSLDELPELWNVVKGEMSLVGPRPLLMQYSDYYTTEELVRFDVRPGITGLAQISGRNNLKWDDRLRIDIIYVETSSLLLDIKILIQTFVKVINNDDVVVDSYEVEPDLNDVRPRRAELAGDQCSS